MSFDNLPPVARNEWLMLNFAFVFAALCVLLIGALGWAVIMRRNRERQGIIKKYVASGDDPKRRRRAKKL